MRRVVKLVRAIRKGWLKLQTQSAADDEAPLYLMWEEDNQVNSLFMNADFLWALTSCKPVYLALLTRLQRKRLWDFHTYRHPNHSCRAMNKATILHRNICPTR